LRDATGCAQDGNMGLVKLALARAPRWTIKRLTETYLTLGLAEIGRAAGINDAEEVRRTVLDMVRRAAGPRFPILT
jgi:COP9 signalosome complex subunit 3